ncbi:uncharacterized protein LOC142228998 [Haematobia irritans]|uniref:uncharacterized protein LOC142228998 n=1 Tax=Haematobia irritans TaxID=7368 RepID=UPI003F4F80E2
MESDHSKNPRDEIASQLRSLGIEFPESATLGQLRVLLQGVVGAAASQDNETSAQNQSLEFVVPSHSRAEGVHLSVNNENYGEIEERLIQRLRILKLQKEIRDLETGRCQENVRRNNVNFSDIENLLPSFSGDDEYSVMKWIADFEAITNIQGCTLDEKFILARRKLIGSANIYLRMVSSDTWDDLKAKLCAEFHKTLSARDVLKKLETRTWDRRKESLHRFVLSMQEISQNASITEAELVEYIVEGLRDKTPAVSIFYNATNISEIKRLIPRYEKIIADAKVNKENLDGNKNDIRKVRCYNCSDFGHYALNCPKEKRPRGSCYICGKTDHIRGSCPLRTVGAIDDVSDKEFNVKPQ